MEKYLIEAEKEWEFKIKEVFDKYFNEFENNYQKMAELSIALSNRLRNTDDNNLYVFYFSPQSKIIHWCDNLDRDTYSKFCKLANMESIIREEIRK